MRGRKETKNRILHPLSEVICKCVCVVCVCVCVCVGGWCMCLCLFVGSYLTTLWSQHRLNKMKQQTLNSKVNNLRVKMQH